MSSLSQHYQQMVGLIDDWVISDVELDVEAQRLTLSLEFVGDQVTCPECEAACSMKDHAPQRTQDVFVLNAKSDFRRWDTNSGSAQSTIGCAVGGTSMRCSFKLYSPLAFPGVRARHVV